MGCGILAPVVVWRHCRWAVLVVAIGCSFDSSGLGSGSEGSGSSTTSGSQSESATAGDSTSSVTGSDAVGSSTGAGEDVEVCDEVDNDGDGLVDEVSAVNEVCGACTLVQLEGSAYFVCDEPLSWADARGACQGRGADLADIEDDAENEFLAVYADRDVHDGRWIGANDLENEGEWTAPDGTPLDYDNFAEGEPNNDGEQDCGQIYGLGLWDDYWCADERVFVCEAPHVP
jgi:hypothetical protein